MSGRRLRVLFVIKNLQQGGTEGQLLQMLETLDASLFEYRLCTVSSEVHYAGLPKNGLIGSLDTRVSDRRVPRRLAAIIDQYRPDLIHSFRDHVNFQIWRALRRTQHQPAVLMSVRGRPIYPQYLALARLISGRCFKVTVNSKSVAAALTGVGRVPAERIEIIHNVSDADRFQPPSASQRREARAALDLTDDGFVLLCPARLSFVKNQIGLIVSLAMLKRRRRLPDDFRLLLPGRVRDPWSDRLMRLLIRAAGLARWVRIPGPIADLRPYYHAADALVLPSWAEGMPNVSLEGHLAGLPAIVSRQANRDEIVVAGETGFVVPTGRPGPLAQAIADMMALPAETRRAMGQRGRARVQELFPRDAALERMTNLYLQAIADRARHAPLPATAPARLPTTSATPAPAVTSSLLPSLPNAAPRPTRAARAR
ncbi:MAG TPA: glycosyltransferase [Polyangia bacterium]|nr:glycosyltransferase [Polyangia bacterium]